MLPEAYISHCTTHRLRIKISSEKRNELFFRTIEKNLLTLPGIESVEANPLTGSVLIYHHVDVNALSQLIQQQRLFSLKMAVTKRTTVRQDVTQGVKAVNAHVSYLTGGKADLLDVAGLYLLGAGVYQLLKGNFAAPAWYTAFWYAFGIMSKAPSDDYIAGTKDF